MEYFSSIGRKDNIHLFIVEGEPHSVDKAKECFNPVIDKLFDNKLAANIHEKIYRLPYLNRQRAYVQLVSKLLNVEFDSIWRRHLRLCIEKIVVATLLTIAVLVTMFCIWKMNKPIDVSLQLVETSEHNSYLPALSNATVSLYVGDDIRRDTIKDIDEKGKFLYIPNKYIDKDVRLTVLCEDFYELDTTLKLSETMRVGIRRNPYSYGNIRFQLYDESAEVFLKHTSVEVDSHRFITGDEGEVDTIIPLKNQREYYHIDGDFILKNGDSVSFAREGSVVLFVERK